MMKHILLFESFNNNTTEHMGDDVILFHGTSEKQYLLLKDNNFDVEGFYLGEDVGNICIHYAEQQARDDDSEPVIIVVEVRFLNGTLSEDHHHDTGRQIGQYVFTGNIADAINVVHHAHVDSTVYDSYETLSKNKNN
jgi:hypothetical protein